ncbi:alpha/beta-hydrolase [Cystobasidium minutum MCA 4210]|uniref:alpha/beta-hydrolase n=1 Tax=Cystobasidium minutum MCA 4210 TaxID=1397322 RepID=UPI0034CF8FE6|eukprot:jgi/Rhomi1/42784/CE42783_1473
MLSIFLASLLASQASAVRLLLQIDLSASTSYTSALLLDDSTTSGSQASSACSRYNEQLLPEVNEDIQDQLRYLAFRGDISNSTRIYIGGSGGDSGSGGGNATALPALRFARRQASQCQAYSVGNASITSVDCSTELPVLCTNSAPPTTVNNTSPSSGSEVVLTSRSSSLSITGYRDARSFRFLGIPFAQPPTGSLRFLPAQEYNGSYSNTTALRPGYACIQQPSPDSGVPASAISEDCLYLNVYSPILPVANGTSSSNGTRTLPVAVWIYGGAFTSGSNLIPLYDGGNLASRGDVIVVTVNYRLGALGNMASSDRLDGNQGISDQVEALRWVQRHIAAFGGDPSRVTIFGESAGAQSVLALMSASSASELFSQAIAQSAPWNPFFSRQVYSQAIYPALLNATNCTTSGEEQQLSCLQALDAGIFLNGTAFQSMVGASVVAQEQFSQAGQLVSAVEPFLPVVGTGLIDGYTDQLIKNGQLPARNKPFLVGNMRDEGVLFVDSVPQLENPVPATNGTLQLVLTNAVDNSTLLAINTNPSLFAFNTSDPDALRSLAGELQTLYVWQCPLQQILNISQQSNLFSSLYTYVFDKGVLAGSGPASCGPNSPSGVDKVCHSEDLLEVFSTSNVLGLPYSEDGGYNSLPFNQYINDVWTSFIRTGNPQPNAEYLQVRGRSYNTTLAWSEMTPFGQYGSNSTAYIQLLDGPPRPSGLLDPAQCQILADSGFLYDNVRSQSS